MKRLGTHLMVIATLLTTGYTSAETKNYSVTGVSANTTLALYAWPDHSAEKINTIPHDAKNISATGEFISLAPTNWIQINWGNQSGWVDLALLKPMANTSKAAKSSVITTRSADEGFVYNASNPPQEQSLSTAPQPIRLPEPLAPANVVMASDSGSLQASDLPWSTAADTIYHDPSAPANAKPLQPRISLAQASLTVARPALSETDGGEMAGDRYGDINATMTVTYMDNGATPEPE